MKIHARLLPRPWLWLALFLLAAAGVLTGAGLFARDAALRATEELVREHLTLYSSYLDSQVDKLSLVSALNCGNPNIIALLENRTDEARRDQVNQGLERANKTADTALIYVMDNEARIIAASDWAAPDSVVGQTRFDRRYWRNTAHGLGTTFVAFGKNAELGYYASCPVEERRQRLGTVAVRAPVEDLAHAWRTFAHERMRLLVADRHGVIFLASEPRWQLRTLAPLSPDERAELERTRQYLDRPLRPLAWQVLQQTRTGSRVATLPTDASPGERHVVQHQKMRETDWTVMVAADLAAVRGWVFAGLATAAGAVALVALLVVYLYQRRRYLSRVFETSIRDPLTGLYTRLYMEDAVAALEGLQDRGEDVHVALAMFDLDHFKRVNDTYGHRCGDAVLREVGRIIREESRDSDIPVRYGGEELAVFLSVHTLDEAVHFAERVSQRMRERERFEKWSLRVTVSAGVALRRPFEPLAHLIERADRHLYAAKRAGRDRVIAENGLAPAM